MGAKVNAVSILRINPSAIGAAFCSLFMKNIIMAAINNIMVKMIPLPYL